jgi:SAM-dependent methyltransferase
MFAPDSIRTTQEMVRVCRPGGRIGFAAWTPGGMLGKIFQIHSRYAPPPPGLPPPSLWGDEKVVRERFADHAASFAFTLRHHMFRAPLPEQWFAFMKKFFGPTNLAWEALDDAQRVEFEREVLAAAAEHNISGDEKLMARGEYLESVITLK